MSEQQQQQQQQQKQQSQPPPCRLESFMKYINFKFVSEEELTYIVDYICGNLNADWQPNYRYWYDMYCYTSKSLIVLRHKKKMEMNFH